MFVQFVWFQFFLPFFFWVTAVIQMFIKDKHLCFEIIQTINSKMG